MEQLRTVQTEEGVLTYVLCRKRVRNLNLRVSRTNCVVLSVPHRCSVRQADEFVRSHSGWICAAVRQQTDRQRPVLPLPPRDECMDRMREALNRVYPLVEPLGVRYPELKIRTMKSQWGNCHWQQGYITLNTALARCPEPLRDYVALHELVHFLHHDHGAGFYQVMGQLMPDWRQRREALKCYLTALDREQ